MALIYLFWISFFLIFYTYIGYAIVLFLLKSIKKKRAAQTYTEAELPEVTMVVAAYNEAYIIEEKARDSLAQHYPKGKLKWLFVTDGSSDETPELLRKFEDIEVHHSPERKGKLNAVNRVMEFIDSPVVVYTDANTFLNKEAVKNIARHYKDPKVGAVAGEKRVHVDAADAAAGAGEGAYWKYESKLKTWDSELYSVVGAAGELFSIRRSLHRPIPEDSIIEDFYVSLKIAEQGYRVVYEPDAYATETASPSLAEELKRKIRIAAGGIQSIVRLGGLLNFFKHGILSFQYVSHRVLRWTLAPLGLIIMLLSSAVLSMDRNPFYLALFVGQLLFYTMALLGYFFQSRKIKVKILFIPLYFSMMNYAVYRGFFRYLRGTQSAVWEKAKRA